MRVPSGPRLLSRDSDFKFSQIPGPEIPRSVFDRSCGYKTTFDSGKLIPIFVDEVLPGDSFKMDATTFARLATPIAPIMDNMYADIHFWFVPYRLLWDNWERFNGAQDNPDDSTDFLVPQMVFSGGISTGDLGDYMGLPVGPPTTGISVSAFPFRAYNLIWNEWYRDQNMQESVQVDKDNGPDAPVDYQILRRGRRHDYFTSALPWPQKGPSVPLLAGDVAVTGIMAKTQTWANGAQSGYETDGSGTTAYAATKNIGTGSVDNYFIVEEDPNNAGYPNIRANLNGDDAQTINSLRQSFQLQRMLERDARGGTRYTEILRSHFGVISPDFRLQRPEFLGGGTTMINVSPIPQTSATDATTPQGNLAAMGTFSHSRVGFSKGFVEHGVVLGLISVRADYSYQQGINRMWSRQTRYDFYWPALSHLGEQAILNKEIYCQGPSVLNPDGDPVDDDVFGYQERFAEYRYKPSLITGQFRSTATSGTPLDFWHLGQEYGDLPTLSSEFIEEDPPIDRVIAVPSEPQFLMDVAFKFKCARPLPVYSVPGLIDHF